MHIAGVSDNEDSVSPSDGSSSSSLKRRPIREMGSVVASITGYIGDERSNLIKLINGSGAYYVGKLLKGSVTHLVCWNFDGPKYEMAKRFGIHTINHRWFEDCFKAGKCLEESPYTDLSGKDVGTLLWKESEHSTYTSRCVKSKPGSLAKIIGNKGYLSRKGTGQGFCDKLLLHVGDSLLNSEKELSDEILDMSDDDRDLQILLQNKPKKRYKRQRKASLGLKSCGGCMLNKERTERDPDCSSSFSCLEANVLKDLESQQESSAVNAHVPADGYKRRKEAFQSLNGCSPAASVKALRDEHVSSSSLGSTEENFLKESRGCPAASLKENSLKESSECPVACTLFPADIECAICHTDHIALVEGVLACGHSFCYQCIMKWASEAGSKTPTCPLCKASFDIITKREQRQPIDGEAAYEESVVTLQCVDNSTSEHLEDNTPILSCIMCGIGDMEEVLLTCNGCRARSAHAFCLDPPWPVSSANQWYCGRCSQRRRADTTWWHQLHAFDSS